MKVALIVLTISLIAGTTLSADDGSWSSTYALTEGSLYSVTENADIALVDEILVFDGFDSGMTRAAFFFKNTSSKALEVQAGFPIKVQLDLEEDTIPGTKNKNGYFFRVSKYGHHRHQLDFARIIFGSSLKKADGAEEDFMGRTYEYFVESDITARREIDAAALAPLFNFSITQDGRKIPLTSAVIETRLVKGTGFPKLDVTFHFRHTLSFVAGTESRVDVRYESDYCTGGDNMGYFIVQSYYYDYILGTGRTWKGPIARLYFALPVGLKPELPSAFKRLGRMGAKDIYLAEQYEPQIKDGIVIENKKREGGGEGYYESLWFSNKKEAKLPKRPAQEFVLVKGASSFLKETADVYTEDGVITRAGFGPFSLFDGIRQTAWCEGVDDDGIGEWVEFELKEDVEALDIQNGYNRSFVAIQGRNIDGFYSLNNRPKVLELISADGKTTLTLPLADSPAIQSFADIYLPKGVYKLIIKDVYRGTKWRDTCLGEIVFYPASTLYSRLRGDAFLKSQAAFIAGP